MMEWVTKIWGRTRELSSSPFHSLHELEVVSGSYCSLHFHRNRANRFRVVSGLIEIVELFGPCQVRTQLGPEDTYDVASLVPHMFIVHADGVLFEEYYPDNGGEIHNDDIVRMIEGGKYDRSKLQELPACLIRDLMLSQISGAK